MVYFVPGLHDFYVLRTVTIVLFKPQNVLFEQHWCRRIDTSVVARWQAGRDMGVVVAAGEPNKGRGRLI